jgi:hypothetical protein
MVARLRTVLFAVAVLTLARVAYAQNIDITIQGNPWKASPMEERQQYLRGREADEMIRKGYTCYHEMGTAAGCTWAKPERDSTPIAHWGKCKQVPGPPKGRICERIAPYSSGFYYYDFERPLVLLEEEIHDAQIMAESDNPFFPGDATRDLRELQRMFLKKAQGIYKRLTPEQTTVLDNNFGDSLDRVFVKLVPVERVEVNEGGLRVSHFQKGEVDPNRWTAAHAKKAGEAAKARSADSAVKPAPIPDATLGDSGVHGARRNLEAKPVEQKAPAFIDPWAE